MPDRRDWQPQVGLTLANSVIDMINCIYVCVSVLLWLSHSPFRSNMCTFVKPKLPSQAPKLGQPSMLKGTVQRHFNYVFFTQIDRPRPE
jgi:hypothetical protein